MQTFDEYLARCLRASLSVRRDIQKDMGRCPTPPYSGGQGLSEWAENMKENGQRFCDVCNEEIPKGAKYQRSQMPAYAAELLRVRDDPDLIPTWTTNTDGTISMDICITCALSMNISPRIEEVN